MDAFATDDLELFVTRVNGSQVLGIRGTVWLVPYDLGVRQDLRLLVRATGEEDVCELDIELTRRAGPLSNWWNLNRVFLADLRKQLLGWRNLSLERMLDYITTSRDLIQEATSE